MRNPLPWLLVLLVVTVLLARRVPRRDRWTYDLWLSGVHVVGLLWCYVVYTWLLRRLGMYAYTSLTPALILFAGLYVIGLGVFEPEWYQPYIEAKWPWSTMSAPVRRISLIAFGVLLLAVVGFVHREQLPSYRACAAAYRRASTQMDSLSADRFIPDTSARERDSRYSSTWHQVTCWHLRN